MKTAAVSDRKIFLGLVILLVLTIILIVGITFIQRPQTTLSDASVSQTEPVALEEPTSIPLPGFGEGESATSGSEENSLETTPEPTVDIPEGAQELGGETTPTTTPDSEATPTPDGTGNDNSTTPTPTDTLLADSGSGPTASATATPTTYTTSTPVPTAIDDLPEAGTIHLTLLMLGASLLLVVFGLAL